MTKNAFRIILPRFARDKLRIWRLKRTNFSFPSSVEEEVEQTIVVLGMHRSGTSLTSNILRDLGVYLGDDLGKADKDNEKGFFENVDFINMNDKILSLAGGSWNNPPSHKSILDLRSNLNLMSEIKSLIQKNERKIWAWKDPRTNLTLDLYLPFLKNPKFIVCFRNPLSVAKSLEKRNGFKIEQGLRLSSIYSQRLVRLLFENPFKTLYLSYEDYFTSPSEQVKKIKSFLGIQKTIDSESIVDKRLKHF